MIWGLRFWGVGGFRALHSMSFSTRCWCWSCGWTAIARARTSPLRCSLVWHSKSACSIALLDVA